MIRKPLPIFAGAGQVRFAGHAGPVQYTVEGDPSKLRSGTARLRGRFRASPEIAADAFRAGDGLLTLEDGVQLRIVMLGHTTGGDEVFVELRV